MLFSRFNLRYYFFRPSLWTFLIAIISYWDDIALHGSFVYDDAGSVKNNVVVIGKVPFIEVLYRDYWGTKMNENQSHKSFRPITTITFKFNYDCSRYQQTIDDPNLHTYGFHIVNVFLHGVVTALVTEASYYVFHQFPSHLLVDVERLSTDTTIDCFHRWHQLLVTIPQLITGFVFGLHPVHAEAVSNITGRGELIMSLFTLLGFLSYFNSLGGCIKWIHVLGIYIIPFICMVLSLFSKEQGATTLLTILTFDFIMNHFSMKEYFVNLNRELKQCHPELQQKQKRKQSDPHGNGIDTNDIQQSDKEQLHVPNNNKINNNGNETSTTNSGRSQLDDDHSPVQFLYRSFILLLQTAAVVLYRYWLNGESSPDFIYDQNPAGFAPERFTRMFSIPYVYCLYIYDILIPEYLCPDWSGLSIPLITSFWNDVRVVPVLMLWMLTFVSIWHVFNRTRHHCIPSAPIHTREIGQTNQTNQNENVYQDDRIILLDYIRTGMLISFFAFTISPFLLSSNLIVVVGLMKADRVIYLPLLGFCVMEGLFFQLLLYFTCDKNVKEAFGSETVDEVCNKSCDSTTTKTLETSRINSINIERSKTKQHSTLCFFKWTAYVLFMIQIAYYAKRVHERNIAWSSSLNLWVSAYSINKRSRHTIYNCGYELSLQKRYKEAEQVLRPIGDPHVEGPSNTFVYAMVLYNLDRCMEANKYIHKALAVIEEKEKHVNDSPRNTRSSLARTKSNLLVAQAYCTSDTRMAGQIMYNAVKVDPTNQYAIEQATEMVKRIEVLTQLESQRSLMMKKSRT